MTRAGLNAGLARCGILRVGHPQVPPGGQPAAGCRIGFDVLQQFDQVIRLLECEGELRFHERSAYVWRLALRTTPSLRRPTSSSGAPKQRNGCESFFLRHFGRPKPEVLANTNGPVFQEDDQTRCDQMAGRTYARSVLPARQGNSARQTLEVPGSVLEGVSSPGND